VRAILAARCVTCHAPGGSAPMPLTTYDETRPWARAIKEQVLARRMPRWHAARGFGAFSNDPTLTPFEIALLVSWIDGGLPRDARALPGATAATRPAAAEVPLRRPVASAFPGRDRVGGARTSTVSMSLPAGVAELTRPVARRWVTGWDFQPGDPLISSASFSLADGTIVGNWVAGDRTVVLPADSGIRISGRLRIELRRRPQADFEHPFTSRPSVLRLATRSTAPRDRVWAQQGACSSLSGLPNVRALAVRPVLEAGASARIALERIGAPPAIVGWFRDFDPAYARTYWLQRPLEFGADARLASDGPCTAAVTLIAPVRPRT
jgi:hypothetical protein